jgi:hypothetical protein
MMSSGRRIPSGLRDVTALPVHGVPFLAADWHSDRGPATKWDDLTECQSMKKYASPESLLKTLDFRPKSKNRCVQHAGIVPRSLHLTVGAKPEREFIKAVEA